MLEGKLYIHKNFSWYAFLFNNILIDTNWNKYEINFFDLNEILDDYIDVKYINIQKLYEVLTKIFDKSNSLKYSWLRIWKILNTNLNKNKDDNFCIIRNIFELENKKTKEMEVSKIVIVNQNWNDIDIPIEKIEDSLFELIDPTLEKIDFILYMMDIFDLQKLTLKDYLQ